ncbi:hypothetical protein VE04_07109 [Pseudogymnoascus sp. 24MN13]|nr:hypothetical protein VE04_07109 [Pseudogymnoascus sp. 24MN13]
MYTVGNIYVITAVAVIGGGLFGFDIASMSAIISTEPYLCYFNQIQGDDVNKCYGPKPDVQGGITAAMPGGSWLGALISVGICSAQVPVYLSEIAPPSKRGRMVGCQQWAITWGIMIMFYISYGTASIKGTAAFRIPWGLQMVPAILLFVFLLFLPESPRWLARQDRWEEARNVLVLVHAKGDVDSPFVALELAEIKATVDFERQNADVTYMELLKPGMINRTHVGIFMQIWSQLTGMNVMMYYISYVFTMANVGSAVLLSSSIQYIINVVMTIPALIWVDRWGRRPTLLVGAALMATWMFANAGLVATYSRAPRPGEFDNAAESFSISGKPATALIASVAHLRVRGKAVALATSSNWAFNFALAYFVPPAFANITWKVYILFGVFCTVMFIHVFFMFPETASKTLEEVENIFDDSTPGALRLIGTPAWKTRVNRDIHHTESGNVDPDKLATLNAYHAEDKTAGLSDEAPKV